MGLGEGEVGDALVGAHQEVDRVERAFCQVLLGLMDLDQAVGSL